MGGPGSGEWCRWDKKKTAESQKKIDIRLLKNKGYFQPGTVGFLSWSCNDEITGLIVYRMEADRIILKYQYHPRDREWEQVNQEILFDPTPCNYGGYRKWFLCPHCLRRVAILYGAGKYFFCRLCYNLTYTSQQENHADRLMRKARNIRKRLGGGNNLMDPFPPKPKGVHWATYWRLRPLLPPPLTTTGLNS